ncbi:methyltransferase domain-containing protein [Candidatus Sumerlaeota bacterium]|nr:methyltransferase domain-containing protein [Candidatus Sumerlaeota bacterium]
MDWNPDVYHKFQAQRFAPFEDLWALVKVRPSLKVVDLGCGTGELTLRLAEGLPRSEVLGIDASAKMLERAKPRERPGLSFRQQTIEEVRGEWDLVFSNAAIQWVEDHERLVGRLFSLLRPGGQLAIQLPSNLRHVSHESLNDVAREEPFREALDGWEMRWPVLTVDRYAQLLFDAGAQDLTVFEKVYPHVLDDADAVAQWNAGTAMLPFIERLPEALHEPFDRRYRERLWRHWPKGPVFYGFHRILFSAVRPHQA